VSKDEVRSKKIQIGTRVDLEEYIGSLLNRIGNLEAEVEALNEIVAELKQERDLYRRIAEFEATMNKTAVGALAIMFDRLSSMVKAMTKLSVENQELSILHSEAAKTSETLTAIIDNLREIIEKYTPRTDLDKAMELLEQVTLLAESLGGRGAGGIS